MIIRIFLLVCLVVSFNPLLAQTNILWTKNTNNAKSVEVNCIRSDKEGNVFVAGTFEGSVDFDPGPGTATLEAPAFAGFSFIQKLDADGNLIWAKNLGRVFIGSSNSIVIDKFGNLILVGFSAVDVIKATNPNPNIFDKNFTYAYILKLNANGELVWIKCLQTQQVFEIGEKNSYAITIDGSGNILATGGFRASLEVVSNNSNLKLLAVGKTNTFIAKLSPDGAIIWLKKYGQGGDNETCVANAISVDSIGNIYSSGNFFGIVNFSPGDDKGAILKSAGPSAAFLQKLDPNGDFVWAKSFPSRDGIEATGLAVAGTDDAFMCGTFSGTVNFDPKKDSLRFTAQGPNDIFIAKFDSQGNVIWVKKQGSESYDGGISICVDAMGNIYNSGFLSTNEGIVGRKNQMINIEEFSGNLNANPISIYCQKLNANGKVIWALQTSYPTNSNLSSITLGPTGIVYVAGPDGNNLFVSAIEKTTP